MSVEAANSTSARARAAAPGAAQHLLGVVVRRKLDHKVARGGHADHGGLVPLAVQAVHGLAPRADGPRWRRLPRQCRLLLRRADLLRHLRQRPHERWAGARATAGPAAAGAALYVARQGHREHVRSQRSQHACNMAVVAHSRRKPAKYTALLSPATRGQGQRKQEPTVDGNIEDSWMVGAVVMISGPAADVDGAPACLADAAVPALDGPGPSPAADCCALTTSSVKPMICRSP